jgi:Fe-Mn family superoxide dismutase
MASKYGNKIANQSNHPFTLPELPYSQTALSDHLGKDGIYYHYEKHHATYVNNLNDLVKDKEYSKKDLEDIIIASAGDKAQIAIFNNAAQVWNHTFFWHSMKENGGGKPKGKLAAKIEEDFGSYDNFVAEFKKAGLTQFGSGWVWLVLDNGKLKIEKTPNAEVPIVNNQTVILTCDVWEHSYYLHFQNRRGDYLDVFLSNLVNWEFAEENFNNA